MLVEHGVPSYQKRGNSNLIIIHRRAIIHSEVFDATDRGTNTGGRTPRNSNTTPVAGHARPAHTEITSATTTQAAAASKPYASSLRASSSSSRRCVGQVVCSVRFAPPHPFLGRRTTDNGTQSPVTRPPRYKSRTFPLPSFKPSQTLVGTRRQSMAAVPRAGLLARILTPAHINS